MTELEIALREAVRELSPLELHGQRNKGDWHGQDIALCDTEEFQTIELGINELWEELENAEVRYNAVKEMHNNSVAYATKIQEELNELKNDVARFMAMDEFSGINEFSGLFTNTERKEYMELRRKLSKVGKEQ